VKKTCADGIKRLFQVFDFWLLISGTESVGIFCHRSLHKHSDTGFQSGFWTQSIKTLGSAKSEVSCLRRVVCTSLVGVLLGILMVAGKTFSFSATSEVLTIVHLIYINKINNIMPIRTKQIKEYTGREWFTHLNPTFFKITGYDLVVIQIKPTKGRGYSGALVTLEHTEPPLMIPAESLLWKAILNHQFKSNHPIQFSSE